MLQNPVDERMKNVAAFSAQINIDSEDSILTIDERKALEFAIGGKLAEMEAITLMINTEHSLLANEKETLSNMEKSLDAKKSDLGVNFITSFFSDDTDLSVINQKIEEQRNQITLIEKNIKQLDVKYKELQKLKDSSEKELSGESKGFLSTVSATTDTIIASITSIRVKILDAYNDMGDLALDMMYVMAAFLLRTLIMPIIFLYALLRAFRLIWNKDLRDVAKDSYTEVRNELRS